MEFNWLIDDTAVTKKTEFPETFLSLGSVKKSLSDRRCTATHSLPAGVYSTQSSRLKCITQQIEHKGAAGKEQSLLKKH